MIDLPILKLAPSRDRRVVHGHPWIYSNEVVAEPALQALPAGSLVSVIADGGKRLGTAMYNPKTLIAGRMLTRDPDEVIDKAFFDRRIARAAELRNWLFKAPYYRLIHAEADGLPAFIVDRYGDVNVVQTNAAGSEALLEPFLAALQEYVPCRAIILKNDSPIRAIEGLAERCEIVQGHLEGPVIVEENGAKFPVTLLGGQKTGWFYDQRANRAFMAQLAAGQSRVLDMYSYAGGFAVQCAVAGARLVLAVDRSEPALELVKQAAALNKVGDRVTTRRGDAFKLLEELAAAKESFDVVIADPPAFIKSKKDHNAGLKAYAKLARLAANLVRPGGYLFVASCSHNASPAEFAQAVARGLADTRRSGRILLSSGAGPDHPVHPFLPESAYLKALVLQVD